MRTETMTCDVCGQDGARTKHVSRSYGKGENMVVIDHIPVIVCPNCGESYMTADTMHEVQRLKLHKRNVKTLRLAPVISYV
jgi:YgiT-type zinc finger domain-containing protein